MNKTLANIKQNRDIGPGLLLLAGLLLVLAKLVLADAQQVFLWPDEAVLDDMVMYNSAVSIAEGNWLGDYDWLVLSKHSFFALWLAVLHFLGIPFLLAGQVLWALGALAAAWAVAPIIKRRWGCLLLFAALLFSPSAVANRPEPMGFVSRPYRDNIFPALCVLCIAGMIGYALRYRQRLRHSLGWLAVAGLALAAAWLSREDGWWLLPFVLGAAGVTVVFVLRWQAIPAKKLLRCLCLLLPLVLLGGGVLGWCGANYARYGRFILSDFSGGEFADAYGAMTRIEHENWDPKVDVPADVRQMLYAQVPEFAELEPLLEGDNYRERYAGINEDGSFKDYSSGGFYWALREAAASYGHYDTPQKAQAYFTKLAEDINALCDSGALKAGPRRSSVSPPIRAEYIGPVLGEGLYSLWFCATFEDCDARSLWSPGGNNAEFYEETLRPMEAFLHEKAATATLPDSTEPYFNLRQTVSFLAFDVIQILYSALLPLGFAAALAWQVWAGVRFFRRLRARQRAEEESLLWIIALGILACILLRAFMIAFVSVSSFNIGTYVMYLAPIHPLMLLYAFIGVWQLVPPIAAKLGIKRQMRDAQKKVGA